MASAAMKASARRSRLRATQQSPSRTGFRSCLLAVCLAYHVQKYFKGHLLPWGPATTSQETFRYAAVNRTNDLLQVHHGRTQKLYADHALRGPETVVFDNDGSMYVMTEDANLWRLDTDGAEQGSSSGSGSIILNATATLVKDLGVGRPLGGRFTPPSSGRGGSDTASTLYIADAILGLTRLANVHDPSCKVEIVASSVVDGGVVTPILYADDVTVGPSSGRVYFTDATTIASDRTKDAQWDVLYASKVDLARGYGTGRLLQYDPATDEVTVLLRGIHFANGLAVDKEETYLLMAESFGVNLLRYNLRDGTTEIVVASEDLPGYLDGVDCSWTTGMCYAVLPSTLAPVHKLWARLPPKVSQIFRTVLMILPRRWTPKVPKFGGLLEINPGTKEVRWRLDPDGKDLSMITGVTEHNGKLYLGSLENDYVGVYSL